ncbi:MAG: peptidase M28, partial [Cytophagales bacterium]
MLKPLITLGLVLTFGTLTFAQKKDIEKKFKAKEAIEDFTYLASDELMGRDPARPEMELAYTYIAEQLESYKVMPIPGADGYFQNIPFRMSSPPKSGSIKIGDKTYSQGQNMLVLDGKSFSGSYELVDVGFGLEEDFKGKDLKGKIAIANVGAPNRMNPADLFSLGGEKTKRAQEAGAVALIERFNIPSIPWQLLSNFLNRTQMTL